jgi:hypothetical protein
MSDMRPAASGFSDPMAPAEKFCASACSAAVQRNTPDCPAPVTATRTPPATRATATPTSA